MNMTAPHTTKTYLAYEVKSAMIGEPPKQRPPTPTLVTFWPAMFYILITLVESQNYFLKFICLLILLSLWPTSM